MGRDSKHQKVGRVGARELEELGTEDGMGDLGSGVGTEGVTGVRQSRDRRVRTRSHLMPLPNMYLGQSWYFASL